MFQGNRLSSRAVWCGGVDGLVQGDLRLAIRGWVGNFRITGLEDLGMSMRIREVCFDWIQFPDLGGLTHEETHGHSDRFNRFNCVNDRFGVLFFINGPPRVQYIGMNGENGAQDQSMTDRIRQFFYLRDTGNNLRINWTSEHPGGNFRTYIENLQLITLSTVITEPRNEQLPGILAEIRRFFIHEFNPIYNIRILGPDDRFVLTDDEKNILRACIVCQRLHG